MHMLAFKLQSLVHLLLCCISGFKHTFVILVLQGCFIFILFVVLSPQVSNGGGGGGGGGQGIANILKVPLVVELQVCALLGVMIVTPY